MHVISIIEKRGQHFERAEERACGRCGEEKERGKCYNYILKNKNKF